MQDFDATYFINGGKFRRYHGRSLLLQILDLKTLILNLRDAFRVVVGIVVAFRLLRRIRPSVVFSKGSFVAVPVGIAAHWLSIPIVSHDSDAVPGLANRIVGKWAVAHATGMPTKYYNYPPDKMVFTGIPLNTNIKKVSAVDQAAYKKQIGVPEDSLVLLLGGAGNGAQELNNQLVSIAQQLLQTHPNLYIINFAGIKHQQLVTQKYSSILSKDLLGRVKIYGFEPDFYKYSGAADVIVTRAGATSLAEFAVQTKACVVVPANFLTDGQQTKNSKILEDTKSAIVLSNSSSDQLAEAINQLLKSPDQRQQLANNLNKTLGINDAAAKLSSLLIKVVKDSEQ